MSFQREKFDPPEGGPDPGVWQVHIAVDPDEASSVYEATPLVWPAEQVELHTELDEAGREGDATLALRVRAEDSQGAIDQASDVYRKVRRAAGLGDRPILVLGYIAPWWRRSGTARHLSSEAMDLIRQGRYELAVIRMQTALELRIADALTQLLADQHPEADPRLLIRRPATLNDARARAFAHMLCGRQIEMEPWWPAYQEHLKRRNAILHEGVDITRHDANASAKATILVHEWLLEAQGVDLGEHREEMARIEAELEEATVENRHER